VAPEDKLGHWHEEFRKWCPGGIRSMVYQGTKNERAKMRKTMKITAKNNPRDVVITSFSIARTDRVHLTPHQWKYVVVDEGHGNDLLMKELKQYNPYSSHLLLTGTPLQNNVAELSSLLAYWYVHFTAKFTANC
jgi:ATP-dependent DNA helicase